MTTTKALTLLGALGALFQVSNQYVPEKGKYWLGLGLALVTALTGYLAKGVDNRG